jgi:uncharacterized protein (DUF697 family)
MTAQEQKAMLTLCLMAAFAEGGKSEAERAELQRIAEGLDPEGAIRLSAIYQDVLLKRVDVEGVAAQLTSSELRQLAYEMAVCVCNADDVLGAGERDWLNRLRAALALDAGAAARYMQTSNALTQAAVEPLAADKVSLSPAAVASAGASAGAAATPVPAAGQPPANAPAALRTIDEAAIDKTILNAAILNGALELLPQSMATMAIVPLQMRLVYNVGRAYGFELDRGHIKDLLAAMGVGLTSQYVEQVGRKLLGGLLGGVAGGLGRAAGRQVAGSAMSFAATWALGQVAKRYYAGGRQLDTQALKDAFAGLRGQAEQLRSQYLPQIEAQSKTIDTSKLLAMVRQG